MKVSGPQILRNSYGEAYVKISTLGSKAMPEQLREAFEKWARKIGFEDFEVIDEDADELELEYCDDEVELVWCAFAEGAANGRHEGEV